MIPSLKYYLSSKLYLLMSLLLLNIFTRSIRFYNIHKHSYKTTFLKVQSSCCLAPLLCYHVEYLLCYHVDYLIVLGVVSLSHSRCSNACIPDHLHWYTTDAHAVRPLEASTVTIRITGCSLEIEMANSP